MIFVVQENPAGILCLFYYGRALRFYWYLVYARDYSKNVRFAYVFVYLHRQIYFIFFTDSIGFCILFVAVFGYLPLVIN